jgi:MFS superfamily sulfate permease-like transporter
MPYEAASSPGGAEDGAKILLPDLAPAAASVPAKAHCPGMAEISTNMLAGLTTSFAAIALGAAFGDSSGRGALVGILSAGLIALITSMFGGTRIQCSGPTAPMTTVFTTLVKYTKAFLIMMDAS